MKRFDEWNEYFQKESCKLQEQIERKITLSTPKGDEIAKIYMDCYIVEDYNELVAMRMEYQNKEICGYGIDNLWVDAFADLQKQLPKGVSLKCCMSCRHGNMCPFGNTQGVLYCTKDLEINSTDTLCDFFVSEDGYNYEQVEPRTRFCTDTCEYYQHQSKDFFTYNDYLYELEK